MHRIIARDWQRPHTLTAWSAALYLAFVMVVLAVSQLVSFEKFPATLEGYDIAWLSEWSLIIAALLTVGEILAIPYLLAMRLSPLAHYGSLVCGGFSLAGWLGLGLCAVLTNNDIANTGVFGPLIVVPSGWWLITYLVGLLLLFGYVVGVDLRRMPRLNRRKSTHRKRNT